MREIVVSVSTGPSEVKPSHLRARAFDRISPTVLLTFHPTSNCLQQLRIIQIQKHIEIVLAFDHVVSSSFALNTFKRLRTATPPSRRYRCEVCVFYSNTPHSLSCYRGKTGRFFAPATVGLQQQAAQRDRRPEYHTATASAASAQPQADGDLSLSGDESPATGAVQPQKCQMIWKLHSC